MSTQKLEKKLCDICGIDEDLQKHHVSYKPEIIIPLCISCHVDTHGHGVGVSKQTGEKVQRIIKTFSIPDDWNHRTKFIKLSSKELQKILETLWNKKR